MYLQPQLAPGWDENGVREFGSFLSGSEIPAEEKAQLLMSIKVIETSGFTKQYLG